ncbi:MAG: DegT/DnrJ/EryC1/StrS family aminotransferase [Acidobacteriota bacterium]|nr:DegT/DnrJ/EryC1/StrS family aminotransferase [Acidobacteriota bacterium]
MKINFMDLKSQYKGMAEEIRQAIDGVLSHGRYVMGPEVMELEEKLAEFTGVKRALGCSSGTDALLIPLLAYGVGPGDAVFTTPFTFVATAEVIALLGATPVFVDIDPQTYNIDTDELAEAVHRVKQEGKLKPRGIIPVDLFGLPADYDAIQAIADQHDLFVLEDAAQSLGGTYKGRPVGGFGHVAATSFYPAKVFGCYGDGGAVFTDDEELYDKLQSIRVHGQGTNKYQNVRIGINGRLDSIQAAVLLVKLKTFRNELDARQRVAERYTAGLKGVVTPHIPGGYRSAWALYSVICEDRDGLKKHLADQGIPSVIYYELSLHLQPAFANLGHRRGDMPVSEHAEKHILSLPMHPFLTDDEIDNVIDAVNAFTA